ncbi:hypothetical protein ACFQ34_29855 [Pseudonocardia benzenivorans]|uniref:Uncharacterized protein n=1 Tax=Pseudonocardia benzenivorans TaxID=228005 RepID=A0ABW3VT62_9PSEU|nr:hypothetical protein PSD17_27890 [Pseudonocardia sp. D17]
MTTTQRVNIGKQHPTPYKTLIALSEEVDQSLARQESTRCSSSS